jgi:hypothetical protein
LQIPIAEMQDVLAIVDHNGKTAVYNLIVNLVIFMLQHDALEHVMLLF